MEFERLAISLVLPFLEGLSVLHLEVCDQNFKQQIGKSRHHELSRLQCHRPRGVWNPKTDVCGIWRLVCLADLHQLPSCSIYMEDPKYFSCRAELMNFLEQISTLVVSDRTGEAVFSYQCISFNNITDTRNTPCLRGLAHFHLDISEPGILTISLDHTDYFKIMYLTDEDEAYYNDAAPLPHIPGAYIEALCLTESSFRLLRVGPDYVACSVDIEHEWTKVLLEGKLYPFIFEHWLPQKPLQT